MPRLWRTEAGDLVEDGHPDARFLAYGEDDQVEGGETVRTSTKKAAAPENKKAPAPKNK